MKIYETINWIVMHIHCIYTCGLHTNYRGTTYLHLHVVFTQITGTKYICIYTWLWSLHKLPIPHIYTCGLQTNYKYYMGCSQVIKNKLFPFYMYKPHSFPKSSQRYLIIYKILFFGGSFWYEGSNKYINQLKGNKG